MRVYRRRRVYTLVVFLALAGIIFLAFQMLSIKVLNFESQQRQGSAADKNCENGFNCRKKQHKDKHYIHSNNNKKFIKGSHRNDQVAPIENKGVFLHDEADSKKHEDVVKFHPKQPKLRTAEPRNPKEKLSEETKEEANRPRGVPQHWARLYKPNAESIFTCTDSKEKIPFDHVNDDYCDCKDGSDEPGTSACINGRFYCHIQLFSHDLKHIPSSQVNDGICDCCDGSDEWDNNPLPEHVKSPDDHPGYGFYQTPCKDRCGMILKQAEKFHHIRQEAMPIKARYIQEAKAKSNPNLLYGEDGEYYVLSKECYQHHAGKYKYTVCPFKEVRQAAAVGSQKIIGRNPAEWVVHQNYGRQLKMAGGDSVQCPENRSRISWLTFTCGLKDKVMSVQETEICEYTVVFSTPVAC